MYGVTSNYEMNVCLTCQKGALPTLLLNYSWCKCVPVFTVFTSLHLFLVLPPMRTSLNNAIQFFSGLNFIWIKSHYVFLATWFLFIHCVCVCVYTILLIAFHCMVISLLFIFYSIIFNSYRVRQVYCFLSQFLVSYIFIHMCLSI